MKSLHLSVAASLKKLRTDYIDILYVHWVSTRHPCGACQYQTHILPPVGLDVRRGGSHERPAQPCHRRQSAVPRACGPAGPHLTDARRAKLNGRAGDLGHTGVGRREGEHLRPVHGEDAVLHIPGALERDAAGL